MSFLELGLCPEILRSIERQGYHIPTPIQEQAIPVVLSTQDLLAAAQTGTGKTAAFLLPILERLKKYANTSASPAMHPTRALILTPTRELADQVGENAKNYTQYLPLRTLTLFGGVHMNTQIQALRSGVEIVIATPGRLLDHIQQKTIQLNKIDILVLDEADRMLDMGFIQDIRKIIALTPPHRQTLLFSATFSNPIKQLAEEFMREPKTIEAARKNSTNEKVEQIFYAVDAYRKRALLSKLIRQYKMNQAIIFCKTKIGTDQLARDLCRDGFNATAIHGDKAQSSRQETLTAFKEGKLPILVATDVAARGLDIFELPFVINYDLPNSPEDYVHRIGRTGRAGSQGIAISLMSQPEIPLHESIEKLTKQTLTPKMIQGFWPSWIPLPHAQKQTSTQDSAFTNTKRQQREIPALLLPPPRSTAL